MVEQKLPGLRKCPPEFYNNCVNALIKCNRCRAGHGNTDQGLYYSEIKPLGLVHPKSKKDKNIAKRTLKARLEEELVRNRIAKRTINSGAFLGDGDIKLLNRIRVEHKDRGFKSTISVSKKEWDKAVRQGISAFALTHTNPETNKKETVYVCTEKLFTELLGYAKKADDAE